MGLNRYDIDFVYAHGNTLLLANTLSRAYLPCDLSNKVASHTIQVNALQPLPDDNIIKVRNAMSGNVEAQALLKVVKNGWPNDRCQLPLVVQPYFPIQDTLSHQDDIILKGNVSWSPRPSDLTWEACATRLCSHTFSVGLILEPREGWIVTSYMLVPRQMNRLKCMEVTYKCYFHVHGSHL